MATWERLFAVSLVACVAQVAIFGALVWAAWSGRRAVASDLRLGSVVLFAGVTAWRVYTTWALFRYRWPDVPEERQWVEGSQIVCAFVFALLWIRHERRRRLWEDAGVIPRRRSSDWKG